MESSAGASCRIARDKLFEEVHFVQQLDGSDTMQQLLLDLIGTQRNR